MKRLISHIKTEEIKKILLISHPNADPDAFCGLHALKLILNRILSNLEIEIFAEGLSSLSEQIAAELNIEISAEIQNFSPDLVILFDVNNVNNIGPISEQIKLDTKSIIIIDHHAAPPNIEDYSPLSVIDDNAISATEIIFDIFDQMDIQLTPEEAFLILLGMLYDSRHFILGSLRSFSIVPKLIESGADYSRAISILRIPMSRPEKIARIKAAQRLEILEIKDWIILTSHVSSYEASACRALLNLGADVVIVTAEKKNEVRISARSTTRFYEQTKIHLGKDIMEKLSSIINGVGGGHATAAGCNGTQNAKEANEQIIKILESLLQEINNNNQL
ncbi:MAG: DHH family phosphoesterase [Candidatus Helarchaeota archaeon]|nr:DHH family phosphoesterase [Candidatus Helarchaeota archaeon]